MKILLPSENIYCYEMVFTLRRFRKPGDVFNGTLILCITLQPLAFHVREQIIIYEFVFVEPVCVQISPKQRGQPITRQPVLTGKPVAKLQKSQRVYSFLIYSVTALQFIWHLL